MLRHARALWGRWWWVPTLPWVGYATVLSAFGRARWEHALVAGLVVGTAYGSRRTRRFFLSALPFLLLFPLYDSIRYWNAATLDPQRVIGCGLLHTERALFGVHVAGALLTPNQILARLQTPALDLLCAAPYGAYLVITGAQWIHLQVSDPAAARRMAWIAFGTHALAFATYCALPAAPPWYVDLHGCAIDPAAAPSPAGLVRVDATLGVTYFDALYSRGATVFGALPSLHVAYPLFALLAAPRRTRAWSVAAQIGYAGLMVFAAIYLDHHWVLDALLGLAYVVLVAAIVRRVMRPAEERSGEERPASPKSRQGSRTRIHPRGI